MSRLHRPRRFAIEPAAHGSVELQARDHERGLSQKVKHSNSQARETDRVFWRRVGVFELDAEHE